MGLPDCGESAGFVLRHSGGNSSRRSQPPEKSRFEFLSNIEVPRRIFLIPTLSIIFAVLAGFAITALFKVFHQPISPAAVVQLHDHPALFAASSMLILLMMHVFDVRERIRTFAIRLMEISLLLIVVGLLLFNFLRFPSVVWVAPATIYYASSTRHSSFFRSLFKSSKGGFDPGFFSVSHLFRCHVHWAGDIDRDRRLHRGHLGHIARPNRHVQTAAEQTLPGPYPAIYTGTAPAKDTPRGLENAHLSPSSWYHVAVAWLLVVKVFGTVLFGANRPGLLYLFAFTIPLAPTFNMLGRYLAWLGIPNGIGALWLAGHPLKGFNLISLFVVSVVVAVILYRKKP